MKSESDLLTFGDTHPVKSIRPGVKRQIMGYDQRLMVVKVWFEEDGTGYEYSNQSSIANSTTQISYVVSGEFDVDFGGEVIRMKGGDSFRVPTNMNCNAVCTKSGVLIDVFSPARDDLLIEAA